MQVSTLDRPINTRLSAEAGKSVVAEEPTYRDIQAAFNTASASANQAGTPGILQELVRVFKSYVVDNFLAKYFPQSQVISSKPIQTLIDNAFEQMSLTKEIDQFNPRFNEIQKHLQASREGQDTGPEYYDWLDFSDAGIIKSKLNETKKMATKIREEGFTHTLVMGMGGSSMCAKLINSAFPNPSSKTAPAKGRIVPLKVETLDTMDPITVSAKLESLPNPIPSDAHFRTAYVVISKSGGTFEVAHQVQAIINYLKDKVFNGNLEAALKRFAENVIFICEDNDKETNIANKLRFELKTKTGIEPKFLAHPPKIGGRYSLFSPVGMLISELKGLNSDGFIAGAQECVDEFFAAKNIQGCDAAKYALLDMLLARDHNFAARYLMPYADRLSAIPEFTAQLAGESNNKNGVDSLNQISGRGSVAHHSDVEALCKNSSRKLLFEEILVRNRDEDIVHGNTGLNSLRDYHLKSMHQDLMTKLALPFGRHIRERMGNPVITTILDKIDEKSIGYLMMRYMLSTVIESGLQEGDLAQNLDRAVKQDQVEFFKQQKTTDARDLNLQGLELTLTI